MAFLGAALAGGGAAAGGAAAGTAAAAGAAAGAGALGSAAAGALGGAGSAIGGGAAAGLSGAAGAGAGGAIGSSLAAGLPTAAKGAAMGTGAPIQMGANAANALKETASQFPGGLSDQIVKSGGSLKPMQQISMPKPMMAPTQSVGFPQMRGQLTDFKGIPASGSPGSGFGAQFSHGFNKPFQMPESFGEGLGQAAGLRVKGLSGAIGSMIPEFGSGTGMTPQTQQALFQYMNQRRQKRKQMVHGQ